MFEKWVYTFGHEMIVLSSRHPLVSGFHKLISICFHTCKEINYFKVVIFLVSLTTFPWFWLLVVKDINLDSCFAAVGPGGNAMETDTDAMETDAVETDAMETSTVEDTTRDRKTCFILFRKFIREVCHEEATLKMWWCVLIFSLFSFPRSLFA